MLREPLLQDLDAVLVADVPHAPVPESFVQAVLSGERWVETQPVILLEVMSTGAIRAGVWLSTLIFLAAATLMAMDAVLESYNLQELTRVVRICVVTLTVLMFCAWLHRMRVGNKRLRLVQHYWVGVLLVCVVWAQEPVRLFLSKAELEEHEVLLTFDLVLYCMGMAGLASFWLLLVDSIAKLVDVDRRTEVYAHQSCCCCGMRCNPLYLYKWRFYVWKVVLCVCLATFGSLLLLYTGPQHWVGAAGTLIMVLVWFFWMLTSTSRARGVSKLLYHRTRVEQLTFHFFFRWRVWFLLLAMAAMVLKGLIQPTDGEEVQEAGNLVMITLIVFLVSLFFFPLSRNHHSDYVQDIRGFSLKTARWLARVSHKAYDDQQHAAIIDIGLPATPPPPGVKSVDKDGGGEEQSIHDPVLVAKGHTKKTDTVWFIHTHGFTRTPSPSPPATPPATPRPQPKLLKRISSRFSSSSSSCLLPRTSSTAGLVDLRTIVVSFRGTASVKNIKTDLHMTRYQVPLHDRMHPAGATKAMRIHAGFWKAYRSCRADIISWLELLLKSLPDQAPLRVLCTGHSLGGGLATLCALEINTHFQHRGIKAVLYTFGSPRVGNRVFARYFNRMVPTAFRVVNYRDLITTGPKFIKSYKHVGKEVWLDNTGHANLCLKWVERYLAPPRTNVSDHRMGAYLQAIDKMCRHLYIRGSLYPNQTPVPCDCDEDEDDRSTAESEVEVPPLSPSQSV